jgi:hypothetical protein
MNLELQSILDRLPSREDVIRGLHISSLQGRHRDSLTIELMSVFGAGLMVGAAVALMLAPRTGRELRSDIRDRATQLGHDAGEALGSARDAASSVMADSTAAAQKRF